MEGDVSNKTIVVLVVLTVIISVLSTAVVWHEVNSVAIPKQVAKSSSASTGEVDLTIEPRKEPLSSSSTAMVSLTILPKK